MCWLPSRVLFITVDGNRSIPAKYILEQAQQCGITFGASRREVRSEKMKNSLLEAIPQLQWAGVNTKGCTAVISVKERGIEENVASFNGISSIVAARDGIIVSCTGARGNMLCRIGQAVYKGDVLISAYTDVGLCVKATEANGEVFAQTLRQGKLYAPLTYMEKGRITAEEKKYGLLIGKKRINLYKGSGISGVSCDKINLEYYVTLPGGFKPPFGLFVSSVRSYDTRAVSYDIENVKPLAEDAAKKYLLSQMVSGKILLDSVIANSNGEFLALSGQYICLEMIGRVQYEENTLNYGENNRKNR
jgi:sporulation protein YqfD